MQKTNVLFVCLGNICRSPMAEAMFKKMVAEKGLTQDFQISSAATSSEEEGNQPHPGARKEMDLHNLDYSGHRSHPVTTGELQAADYIITMDNYNIQDLAQMLPKTELSKLHLCMEVVPGKSNQAIVDPWYTHRFNDTYQMLAESLPLWLTQMEESRKDHHGK